MSKNIISLNPNYALNPDMSLEIPLGFDELMTSIPR